MLEPSTEYKCGSVISDKKRDTCSRCLSISQVLRHHHTSKRKILDGKVEISIDCLVCGIDNTGAAIRPRSLSSETRRHVTLLRFTISIVAFLVSQVAH